jgi:hypothetical protein
MVTDEFERGDQMRVLRAIVGLGAVLLLAGCGTAESQAAEAPLAAAKPACAKTAATPLNQRPAVLSGTTGSWYGSGDLWVGLPDRPAGGSGQTVELKFPWVTLAGDKPSRDLGLPEVTAVQAGATDSIAATFSDYARAYGTTDLAFWPSTLAFPQPGCWTVTGKLKATTVQFTVEVKAP